jgi:hypothetical protein
MDFFKLDKKTQNNIFSKLLTSFDVNKVYHLLLDDKWDGWKPNTAFDVYRSVDESYRSLVKDYERYQHQYINEIEVYCASGGKRVGVYNNILYVIFDWEQISHRLGYKDIIDVQVSTQVNVTNYLRMNKINKIKEVIS